MAVINNATLKAIDVGFQHKFKDGLASVKPEWQHIATEVPSNSHSEVYGWIGEMPNMREWVGERVLNDIMSHDYTIKNKDFESTISVKRTDIEDDNFGVFGTVAQAHGESAGRHTDQLAFGALKAGTSELCYDGQSFFDTDHPVNTKHDGTGTVETVSNFDDGTNATWYLLDTSRVLKPIIYQNRKNPELTAMTKLDDESVFMRNVYRWGAYKRGNSGYGFWQMAHASKLELTPRNLNAAVAKMKSRKGDGGRELDIKPTIIVVPPALEAVAKMLVMADEINGTTNINKGTLRVLATSRVID